MSPNHAIERTSSRVMQVPVTISLPSIPSIRNVRVGFESSGPAGHPGSCLTPHLDVGRDPEAAVLHWGCKQCRSEIIKPVLLGRQYSWTQTQIQSLNLSPRVHAAGHKTKHDGSANGHTLQWRDAMCQLYYWHGYRLEVYSTTCSMAVHQVQIPAWTVTHTKTY